MQDNKIGENCYICPLKKENYMAKHPNSDEFYAKLKAELETTSDWPSEYLYKYIVPTDREKIELIERIFDNMGAVIKTKTSSKGKYTSVSVYVNLPNPDAVIEKYREVGDKVEGVISL